MTPGFSTQLRLLFAQGWRGEMADKERLISPILFAVTMLLVFAFAIGEVDRSIVPRIFLAETFLTLFFALQLSFARVFDADRQDRVFDVMRSYPIGHSAWFLSKYGLVVVMGVLTLVPTMAVGALLNQQSGMPSLLNWVTFGVAMLTLLGLAALGVLLSAMTLRAQARQMLYPLLYFPLTAPVLLAAVQASLLYMEAGTFTDDVQAWLGLLAVANVIYFTLSLLLFGELVDD
jgi:ABC-type transport system involved in cytochrome c biogenesis permease component